jgi:hypothetical protein
MSEYSTVHILSPLTNVGMQSFWEVLFRGSDKLQKFAWKFTEENGPEHAPFKWQISVNRSFETFVKPNGELTDMLF